MSSKLLFFNTYEFYFLFFGGKQTTYVGTQQGQAKEIIKKKCWWAQHVSFSNNLIVDLNSLHNANLVQLEALSAKKFTYE